MTTEEYVACGLFILAITLNCLMVYLQKRRGVYDRFGDNAHKVHASSISIVWLLFVMSYVWLETQTVDTILYQSIPAGYAFKLVAVALFVLSLRQIGIGALTNKDLFTGERRQLKGIYRFIPEPIYVSYTLFIAGSALATGAEAFYYMIIISFTGLQIIEAKIEALK